MAPALGPIAPVYTGDLAGGVAACTRTHPARQPFVHNDRRHPCIRQAPLHSSLGPLSAVRSSAPSSCVAGQTSASRQSSVSLRAARCWPQRSCWRWQGRRRQPVGGPSSHPVRVRRIPRRLLRRLRWVRSSRARLASVWSLGWRLSASSPGSKNSGRVRLTPSSLSSSIASWGSRPEVRHMHTMGTGGAAGHGNVWVGGCCATG